MSTVNDNQGEIFLARSGEANSVYSNAFSAISDLANSQKEAMDASISKMETLNQSLIDLYESDSIDFGIEGGAYSDRIIELREKLMAEKAVMAELFEKYNDTLEVTQAFMGTMQQIMQDTAGLGLDI